MKIFRKTALAAALSIIIAAPAAAQPTQAQKNAAKAEFEAKKVYSACEGSFIRSWNSVSAKRTGARKKLEQIKPKISKDDYMKLLKTHNDAEAVVLKVKTDFSKTINGIPDFKKKKEACDTFLQKPISDANTAAANVLSAVNSKEFEAKQAKKK